MLKSDTENPSAPSRPSIVVTRKLAPQVETRMAELFDASFNSDDLAMSSEEIVAAAQNCDVLVPTVTDNIDAALIQAAGTRLKLIASFGAGVDHIDLKAARARNITVTNTPGVFTDDTADMTMALILSVPRRLAEGEKLVRSGEWAGWRPSGMLGHRIGGKRLGIIGMGRIGQAVAHRARGFGLEVSYHNRRRLPESFEKMLGAHYEADVDTLVAQADILSLHCPYNSQSHHLLNAARIASMKPDAYVINTSRGEIIEEPALIDALEKGRIGGAGLDVYANEPAVDPRLLDLKNTVLLPHLGSATFEGRREAGEKVIANIQIWSDGHRPPNQVLEGWL